MNQGVSAPPAVSSRASIAGALFICLLLGISWQTAVATSLPNTACRLDRAYEKAVVDYVYDGDTLRLADGRKIRLVGLNSPEIGRHDRPSEPYAEQARNALMSLAGPGVTIQLRYDHTRYDRYKRTLAHIFLADGANISERLLENGFATTLVVPPNFAFLACYREAEKRARSMVKGIWSLARYHPVDASALPRDTHGFRLVKGKISRIGESRGNIWLNLTPQFALRIPRDDLEYFQTYSPLELLGRTLVARGWVQRQHSELRITIHHPAALELSD